MHPVQEKLRDAPSSAVFICVGATCSLPVSEASQISSLVEAMRRRPLDGEGTR
jgi:hypothetical protein